MQSKAQIDEILRQKSDSKEIPGVVAIAADGNDVLYEGAFGKRDLSKPDAMTPDRVLDRLDDESGDIGRRDAAGRAGQAVAR